MVDFGSIKKKAEALKGKAEGFVDDHKDQIGKGLDKAGDFVGKKTKKEEQVDKAVGKVKGLLDRDGGSSATAESTAAEAAPAEGAAPDDTAPGGRPSGGPDTTA